MSLKTGDWKMNVNGAEGTLNITNVDPNSGAVLGQALGQGLSGLWDETSRTLTFAVQGPPVAPPAIYAPPVYKAFLFSTPRNPAPGQDVLWTLAGFVQGIDSATAGAMGGNARRTMFGWFAQITEVA